jgi:hypothetical protein
MVGRVNSQRSTLNLSLLLFDPNIPPENLRALGLEADVTGVGILVMRDLRNQRAVQLIPDLAIPRSDFHRVPLARGCVEEEKIAQPGMVVPLKSAARAVIDRAGWLA